MRLKLRATAVARGDTPGDAQSRRAQPPAWLPGTHTLRVHMRMHVHTHAHSRRAQRRAWLPEHFHYQVAYARPVRVLATSPVASMERAG